MEEKEEESKLKYLKDNIYSQLKKLIFPINIKVEFNMIMNFLKDMKNLRAFVLREMHGICSAKVINGINYNENFEFCFIFPKKKGEFLEIKDFMANNIKSNNSLSNNYIYRGKIIYIEEWENYKKIIIRFYLLNSNNENNNIIKNSVNEKSNFIDVTLSFYIDINDNSTVIINELLYDIKENEFSRFNDLMKIFFKKIKCFLEKNFNTYICNESILINRSIGQIFNYIMSLKIFYNKRFEIKEIQKFKNEINIYIDIRDKQYPESVYHSRCHILGLSEISSFVTIITLIDVKYFSLNKRLSTLKAAIILVLKLLKRNIEKEIIEN